MFAIDTDIKKKLKPTVKSIIVLTVTLVVILLLGFFSFFFSYDAYERVVIVDYDITTNLYPYNVIEMIGYEEVPGGLIAVREHPQIFLTPPDHAVEEIRVVFKNPLLRGAWLQVFFAENHEPLSGENAVYAFFTAGATELIVNIPEGSGADLTSLRVDIGIFGETFELYGIYASEMSLIWAGNNEWLPLIIVLGILTIGLWFVYIIRRSPEGSFEKFKKVPTALWVFVAVIAILFVYYHHRDVLPRAEQPLWLWDEIDSYRVITESIDTSFILGVYWIFSILLLVGLLLTVYLLYIKNIKIETAFLVVASIIGFVYLFLTFNSVLDGSIHFQTSYAYSNVILGHPIHSARDIDPDPERWVHTMEDPYRHNWIVGMSCYAQMHDSLFEGAGDYEIIETELWILRRENIGYIPPALGIAIARLFSASTTMLHFAAGLAGMIFFIAGTFLAIKIMPFGKMVLFCVALFPTTMNQAASCNPDNVMNVLAFLLIAMVFYIANKVAQEEKIRVIEIIFLCVVCAALVTMRGGVYLPLIGLLLLIFLARKRKLKLTKSRILLCIGIVAAILVPLLIIHLSDIITLVPGGHTIGGEQLWSLSQIIQNPGETWYLAFNTLVRGGETLLLEAVGMGLGWPWQVLPHFLPMSVFILLAFLSIQNISLTTGQRKIIGITAAATVILVYFAMLMAVTPHHSDHVWGVQGRYFTPILPLVFLLFAGAGASWIKIKHDITKGIITTLFCLQILVMVNYFVIAIWR